MSTIKNYRMFITKPEGWSSQKALNYLGWKDRRQVKMYMLRSNVFKAEIPTKEGNIAIQLVEVDKPIKRCKVLGCHDRTVAKGLCMKHYRQVQRHGKVTDEEDI